jgi:Ca2+-transporting ATPase
MHALALCNDVARGQNGEPLGDPTEVALWRAASEAGFDKSECEKTTPRVMELPFDSERKQMTTLHAGGGFIAYTKGAPEAVFGACVAMATSAGAIPFERGHATHIAEQMAQDGLRVLAVACRRWKTLPVDHAPYAIESGLTLVALVGLLDPPREEARAAVQTCLTAGIRPVMITGDHPVTARAIARQVGILIDNGKVLTGREIQTLSDAELRAAVGEIRVYARVDPAQKIRIVAALQDAGEIVAMTGDGVNDAPALARAEIGVAMGRGGTDVAREAASLVLLDDNFATIVAAVREGRRIYDNIRKFVRFVVTCNSAEIWTIFLAPFLGLPLPMMPIQILWMNLVTDGLPGLALAAEPAESDVMHRPPRLSREGLLSRSMVRQVIWAGLLMAASALLTEALAIYTDHANWQTMVFTVLTLTQMWQVLAIRSDHDAVFQSGFFANRPLLGAVLITFVLQLAVIYVPSLNVIFNTGPLTIVELLICIGMSSLVFVALDIEKRLEWRQKRPARRR